MMIASRFLLGCATCGFDRSGQIGSAAEGSILFLLGVIFSVLGVLLFVIFSFARKARLAGSPGGPATDGAGLLKPSVSSP